MPSSFTQQLKLPRKDQQRRLALMSSPSDNTKKILHTPRGSSMHAFALE